MAERGNNMAQELKTGKVIAVKKRSRLDRHLLGKNVKYEIRPGTLNQRFGPDYNIYTDETGNPWVVPACDIRIKDI